MKSGHADLPLHYGTVPAWLAQRMSLLGGAIVETIVMEYGRSELLRRLGDPFWFQSLGCVLGMDWHSSGITTSVMHALKKAVNVRSQELGIYICGGRGRSSRQTPDELLQVAERTGLDGQALVRSSRLAAKVDNTAVQDGFQLYLHNFVVTSEGEWAVVQQGMNPSTRMARRYHWLSSSLHSFTEEPHTAVCGRNQGLILNLTHRDAAPTKESLLALTRRGCGELAGGAALCRVLLAPGDCGPELANVAAETVVTYGLSARDSLTLSSLTEPVLCVQRRLPRPDGGFVEPQEFPLPELPAPAEELLPLLGLRLLQLPQTGLLSLW